MNNRPPSVPSVLIGSQPVGDSATRASSSSPNLPSSRRAVTSLTLSPYEWFFAAMLLGAFGIPLCFELWHLNPSPEERLTAEIERLGGRIEFLTAAGNTEPCVVIDLGGKPIRNADLVCLEQLSRVDRLDLSHTPITDEGLHYVAALPTVHVLDVSRTAVTDAGMQALRNVRGLRRLALAATRITDTTIESVVAVQADLEELDLEYTDVGDAGLQRLARCPHLKKVRLGGTRVSPEALTTLRSARPDLELAP